MHSMKYWICPLMLLSAIVYQPLHGDTDIQMGCRQPKEGPQGPTGPQGPAGPTGPTGPAGPAFALSALYAESNFDGDTSPFLYTDGQPVQFTGTYSQTIGTGITQTNSSTFTFAEAGVYEVTFTGYVNPGNIPPGETTVELAGVYFALNASPVGALFATLMVAGEIIVEQTILTAAAGDTLQAVTITDATLAFDTGAAASIKIVKLADVAP